MAKNEMNDQLIVRRQKMEELRENGIEPFGQRKFDRQDLASTLEEKYGNEDKE
ncbi:MAG: lysine--tRNA ligase, partial [Lactobacillus crispatus]|nr:lysine--tRNA ligase [Lactobacillus crispatus]